VRPSLNDSGSFGEPLESFRDRMNMTARATGESPSSCDRTGYGVGSFSNSTVN
jgi:hypothetical protein